MHCKPIPVMKTGFSLWSFSHREKPVFIAGISCNTKRFFPVLKNFTGKTLFSPCNDPVRDCSGSKYLVHQIRNLNFQSSKLKFPMLCLAWQLLQGLCNLTLCLLLISKFIYVLLWHPRPIQIGSFLKEDKKIGDTKLNLVQQESFSSRLESFWSALQLKQTHFSLRNWAQQIQSITLN